MTLLPGGARIIGLAVLVAIVVFTACAALGFAVAGRDRIVPGVVVLGVPVGGLTRDDAATRLGPPSAHVLDQPVQIRVGDKSWATSPRAMGLRLDPTELADAAFSIGHGPSFVGNARAELHAVRSETAVSISSTSDGSALSDLIRRIASEVDSQPVAAELALADDGTVTFRESHTGVALDQAAARALVAQALVEGGPSVTLPTNTLPPAVATEQVNAAHEQLYRMLRDPAPIQLNFDEQHWTVERAQLLTLLTLTQPGAPNATASVEVRSEPVQGLMQPIAAQIARDAQDARFTWADGQVTVLRQGINGRGLNQPAAIDRLKAAILAGDRAVDLPVEVVHPAVATDDAAQLGIRELIGESTTSFAGAIPEKAHNIQLAAQRLNGVVVPPGRTFSFNKEVGPTTLEAGFSWGFGLTGGGEGGVHTVPSVAGGICQVATTLFQPVFWSGYQIEERYWHLYWIPAYTSRGVVGLDATVDADSGLDFKWINPTDQTVLIQSSTDAEHVTFRLYGQKPAWNVQVDDPVISGRIAADPTPEVQDEPSLPWGRTLAVESARDGFTVVLSRHVTPNGGGAVRELALKSVYAPSHTVTLVGSRGAPDSHSVAAAVDQLRGRQQASGASSAAGATTAPTHNTPNGPRTIAQIRDELRRAGWGGGSDQDAVETYNRVAAAAQH
jgi:vancomycin resistance protein YoaR